MTFSSGTNAAAREVAFELTLCIHILRTIAMTAFTAGFSSVVANKSSCCYLFSQFSIEHNIILGTSRSSALLSYQQYILYTKVTASGPELSAGANIAAQVMAGAD
jgi:hypothetical protein